MRLGAMTVLAYALGSDTAHGLSCLGTYGFEISFLTPTSRSLMGYHEVLTGIILQRDMDGFTPP